MILTAVLIVDDLNVVGSIPVRDCVKDALYCLLWTTTYPLLLLCVLRLAAIRRYFAGA